MNSYKTYITIVDPKQVVLSNLPFQAGQRVEVEIKVVDEEKLDLTQRWQNLLKKTQELHAHNPLTEEEIAAEIEAYRRGE
jgi:antitoxin ParD1/3/4